MEKFQQISFWRTMFLLATVIFFFSCKPGDGPDDPTDPTDPTPNELVKPVVKSLTVENVTATSAKISAWVTPNEKDTKVSVEYKKTTENNYQSQAWVGNLSGKDSIKVSFDVVLTANNEYVARIKASNKAGDNIAVTDVKFSTHIVTDYDGNTYQVIKIGNQYWLRENFKGTKFADGTDIENVTGDNIWSTTTSPARCWLNNDIKHKDILGGLYNSYVYTSPKKLINGWHVPSFSEVQTLVDYLGGSSVAMPKLMDNSGKHWIPYQSIYNVKTTNSSGFTAIPSLYRVEGGIFSTAESLMLATTEYDEAAKVYFAFKIGSDNNSYKAGIFKRWGLSIRLVKD